MRELRTAIVAVIAFTVLLGLAYPLAMTGVSQVVFPNKADGSVIERDGKAVGSRLIGQDFSKRADSFQSRPSVTEYNPSGTFFNNQGPNQQDLADQLKGYVARLPEARAALHPGPDGCEDPGRRGDHLGLGRRPADLSRPTPASRPTASRASATCRSARARSSSTTHSSRPLFGLAGPKSVNVLELNLALDQEAE